MILFELFYCFSTQMERVKLLLDVKRQTFPASFKKEHPTEVSYIYSEHLHIYLRGWMTFVVKHQIPYFQRGRHGRDHMVVVFTTTYAISAYHHWCWEFESRSGWGVQHYVIKFVSGFLRVLWFPPPRYNWNIVESGVKHHQTNKPYFQYHYRYMDLKFFRDLSNLVFWATVNIK